MKGTEIKMTSHDIATGIKTWNMWPGFSGEYCQCGATVNTFSSHGYFCPNCDRFNIQCFHGGPMPHRFPEFGPTLTTIRKGGKIAMRWSAKTHKFIVGQRVWVEKYSWPMRRTVVLPGRIVTAASDCYPFITHYYVRLNGETYDRHKNQDEICARNDTTSFIRKRLFVEKNWIHDIWQISVSEIYREFRKKKAIDQLEQSS